MCVCVAVGAVTVISPLELVRTKMQSRRLPYSELRACIRSAVAQDGLLSLWRGWGPTVLRDVPFSGESSATECNMIVLKSQSSFLEITNAKSVTRRFEMQQWFSWLHVTITVEKYVLSSVETCQTPPAAYFTPLVLFNIFGTFQTVVLSSQLLLQCCTVYILEM